jgi:hypothetical protein
MTCQLSGDCCAVNKRGEVPTYRPDAEKTWKKSPGLVAQETRARLLSPTLLVSILY